MKQIKILGLALTLGLLIAGGSAFAYMSGYGHGGMMGSGYGHMMDYGYYGDNGYSQEHAALWNELHQTQAELNRVLNAPEIDTARAKELQSRINELGDQLSREQAGPGYHMGYGNGGSHGPGYHWR